MGCDGGTIPRRDELVKTKKKPESKDKDLDLIFKWRHCAITHEALQDPVVTCGLGKLYNKVALIEALINKETLPESSRHIKSLRDVKDLNLTLNPAFNNNDQKDGGSDLTTSPYICPISGLEMSGKFRFVALWSCGCVFAERALKEINVKNCPQCQKVFDYNDVVIINGTDEDLIVLKDRMETRQKSNKKTKKVKREPVETIKSELDKATTKADDTNAKKDVKVPMKSGVLKREAPKSESEEVKKTKLNYSVAKDPKVTDVYKSLFTSHKSEKEQDRAHWVTYNPFYN